MALAIAGSLLLLSAAGPTSAMAASTDLRITKADNVDPVSRGATLTYTIVVTNLGPATAAAVVVEDKLPGGLDFVSMATTAGTCSRQGKTVTCSLGTMLSLAQATVTIRARVTKNKGAIDNTATVEAAEADLAAANNSDTEKTTIGAGGPTCRGKVATIVGTPGNNTLLGTGARDVVVAGGGDDLVVAGGGRDLVCAGSGADVVRAGARADVAIGGGGNDLLVGRGGADSLLGKAGRDRLRGGAGPDLLAGGIGIDRCRGGAGADTLRSC